MKRLVLVAFMAAATVVHAEENWDAFGEEAEFDRAFVGVSGALVVPQGGQGARLRGGAGVRAGYYLTEFWAVEGGVAAFDGAAGLSADALWHWWGYERLDPFFTFGAEGCIGSDGQFGPKAGAGTFYHLTDSLSLRFDADAVLALDGGVAVDYALMVGVQFSF